MSNKHVTVIGEVGINHNGDMSIVKQLIDGAKWAGADLVKFQKRTIDKVYTKEELDKPRESVWGKTNRDQKNGLELSEKDYDEIDRYCKEIGIGWFASPWDLWSIEFLKKYKPEYWKIPSALLTHIELCTKIAQLGKYTFIATGMSTIEEISKIVSIFKSYECPFELMHCNSAYPADEKDLNLNVIPYFKKLFSCNVGYSGHEVGLPPSIIAVALGATSVERHITLNRTMYGSDQAASVEIDGFRKLVQMIRQTEIVLGDGIKTITPKEAECKKKLRRTCDY